MVKGIAKRVVVIKSPDPKVFEQALFIVREDVKYPDGVSGEEIICQAQRVADRYIRGYRRHRHVKISGPVFMLLGGLLTSAVWILCLIYI